MSCTFVWDLDDTLVVTQTRFNQAIWVCGELINRAVGHGVHRPTSVLRMHEAMMDDIIRQGGRANDAFVDAWVLTYRRLAETLGRSCDRRVEQELRDRAEETMLPPFELLPGALEMLQTLRWLGSHHLLTIAHEVQHLKIDTLGLRMFFNSVQFAKNKENKRDKLQALLGGVTGHRFVIGDSRGAEIRYAVELGYTAIWLHHPDPWSHFDANLNPASYHTVRSLVEIPPLVRQLVATDQPYPQP